MEGSTLLTLESYRFANCSLRFIAIALMRAYRFRCTSSQVANLVWSYKRFDSMQ